MKSTASKRIYAVLVAVAIAYAFFTVRGAHGYSAWLQKRQEARELEERNATLARENQLRREYLGRLRNSSPAQELEIRRRLNLVKPDDKVYLKKVTN